MTSLAIEPSKEPYDPHCGCWSRIRDWDAIFARQQYVPLNPIRLLLFAMMTEDTDVFSVVDPEMRAEFEEQQKKSVLSGGASGANPLQNFDMAAWMAGKTSGAETSGSSRDVLEEKAAGNKRRKG